MNQQELMTIQEAGHWASNYLGKNVTASNISYLVQYGRVKKNADNGLTRIAKADLLAYYDSYKNTRAEQWKDHLSDELNWALSFDQYKEAETTKHVHRLHPYKGKFIPQLVEYFLDQHTDKFKSQAYFKKGDIILDPFSGSGTTMVQASELGLHCLGIDVSEFNTFMGNCKVNYYDLADVMNEVHKISNALKLYLADSHTLDFDKELNIELSNFNNKHFPVPEYKYQLRHGSVDEEHYGKEKESMFLDVFSKLVNKYKINITHENPTTFIDKWYSGNIRNEINLVYNEINNIKNQSTRNIISLMLSRTIRSCRATTHADLATLLEPKTTTYYCAKHGKICKPLYSINKWWATYSKDTIARIAEFNKLRSNTIQHCLTGDSRELNIISELNRQNPMLANLIKTNKIRGIFSSPPYVGLIDYHEQHAYAYELFNIKRKDEYEIGPLFMGKGKEAKQSYIKGISDVLINCRKYLVDDFDVFLVANDKYNMYPTIANNADMKIAKQFKRPVLNRTEKGKGIYSESIFHLVNK